MPQYTDEQAREQERPMSEVYAYYEDLAQQRRPIVERAIATLTGQEPPTTSVATPTTEESDVDLDDEPEPAPEVDDEPTAGDPEPEQ